MSEDSLAHPRIVGRPSPVSSRRSNAVAFMTQDISASELTPRRSGPDRQGEKSHGGAAASSRIQRASLGDGHAVLPPVSSRFGYRRNSSWNIPSSEAMRRVVVPRQMCPRSGAWGGAAPSFPEPMRVASDPSRLTPWPP